MPVVIAIVLMALSRTPPADGLRCLLVSYAELGVNSTEHVAAFGRGLAALGWEVHVAVLVLDSPTIRFAFHSCTAAGLIAAPRSGRDLMPADVVHVWTPRGAIWDFIAKHSRLIGRALILHLEDDEDEVLKAFSPESVRNGGRLGAGGLHRRKLAHLSHPLLTRCLASCADGVTVLSPELSGLSPEVTPALRVVPPLDAVWFSDADHHSKAEGEHTVVFSGGVHAAVVADFHALCRAVGMLVEKGRRVRLVRCGPAGMPPRLIRQGARLAGNFQDVGFLSREKLTSLLASATVLVQPGGPTVFNRRRFPAKLAPYLASGTPVVMPACYAWIGVKPGEHAVMFERGTADDIARAIETVLDSPEKSREMGKRAAAFARAHFSPEQCCRPLDEFYRNALARRPTVPWQSLVRPRVELPLWVAAHPARAGNELRAALTKFADQERIRAPAGFTLPKSDGPLVSVVVPNFNHRKFLPERFRSIFEQTYRNLEVVVLDDASTDGSLDYIRALQSPFPLRVIANPTNSGSVFRQWHRGVAEASGEFVWIAESDDSCAPDLIEKLMAVALRNPEIGLAYAQSRIVDERGHRIGSFLDYTDEIDRNRWRQDYVNSGRDEAARYLVVRNTIPNASACLFRRAALAEVDLLSLTLRVCGDWMTYARICERHDVAFVSEELNYFRRHGSTARESADRSGGFVTEAYAVQNHLSEHFQISPETREAASRATFRDLLHRIKTSANAAFIDDSGLLASALRFDPRFRERLAGRPTAHAPIVTVRCEKTPGATLSESRSYHAWRWTAVRFNLGPGSASIIPISHPGLVALRRIRVHKSGSETVLWCAENAGAYRQIELGGNAHRIASDDSLEIFSWGHQPVLRLPLAEGLRDGGGYELQFEIRWGALPRYEPRRSTGDGNRALFILPHLELGGADRCNLDLIGQLTKRFGWKITVATTRPAHDEWQASFEALTDDIFLLHRFLPVAEYAEFLAYLIESRRPKVVYLSHSELGYRLLPWLRESFPGLPIVDLLHVPMDDWKQGGFPRFSFETQAFLAGTVVTSQWLKTWMVQHGCDERRLSVIYTGIDTALWRPTPELTQAARARWALPADRPVILFAGRFAPQKSPGLLLPLVAALEARGRRFLLVLAGDGPQRLWLEKNLAEVHPQSVRMIGAIPPDEMLTLMSAADILLLPSQVEGVALVLFEAMAMGVVPVATDVGGQRELVTAECGRLVAPGPQLIETLVDALDSLLTDGPLRAGMSAQARVRVEAEFGLNQTGDQIDALFRDRAQEASVNWEKLPSRREISPGLLEDLDDLEAQALAGDEWSRQVNAGRWLPTTVSKVAAFLRASPCGGVVRRFENRYGERLGRWIVSESNAKNS